MVELGEEARARMMRSPFSGKVNCKLRNMAHAVTSALARRLATHVRTSSSTKRGLWVSQGPRMMKPGLKKKKKGEGG